MNDRTEAHLSRLVSDLRKLGVADKAGTLPDLVDKAASLRDQLRKMRTTGESTWAAVVDDMVRTGEVAERHATAVADVQIVTAVAPADGSLAKATSHAVNALIRDAEAAGREQAPKLRVALAAKANKAAADAGKLPIPEGVRTMTEAFEAGVHSDTWAEANRLAAEFDRIHDCYDLLREWGWLPAGNSDGGQLGPGRFRYADSKAAGQTGVAPPLRLWAAVKIGAGPGLYDEAAARQHLADAIERNKAEEEAWLKR